MTITLGIKSQRTKIQVLLRRPHGGITWEILSKWGECRLSFRKLTSNSFYNGYMHLYASEIQSTGASQTLEKYIFHENANLTSEGHLGPQMVNRLVGGLLHPLIHVGHWAEFGVSGMLAEGA